MRRKMNGDEYHRLGITAKKRGNDWELFLNDHLVMIGLSDKDFELFKQKSAREVLNIFSQR
jgi:hypothetical protein